MSSFQTTSYYEFTQNAPMLALIASLIQTNTCRNIVVILTVAAIPSIRKFCMGKFHSLFRSAFGLKHDCLLTAYSQTGKHVLELPMLKGFPHQPEL